MAIARACFVDTHGWYSRAHARMGKDYLGADQRRVTDDKKKDDEPIQALDAGDIAVLKTYGVGPYDRAIKKAEQDIQDCLKRVNELSGTMRARRGGTKLHELPSHHPQALGR